MLTVVMAAAIKNIPPNDNTVNMTTVCHIINYHHRLLNSASLIAMPGIYFNSEFIFSMLLI